MSSEWLDLVHSLTGTSDLSWNDGADQRTKEQFVYRFRLPDPACGCLFVPESPRNRSVPERFLAKLAAWQRKGIHERLENGPIANIGGPNSRTGLDVDRG